MAWNSWNPATGPSTHSASWAEYFNGVANSDASRRLGTPTAPSAAPLGPRGQYDAASSQVQVPGGVENAIGGGSSATALRAGGGFNMGGFPNVGHEGYDAATARIPITGNMGIGEADLRNNTQYGVSSSPFHRLSSPTPAARSNSGFLPMSNIATSSSRAQNFYTLPTARPARPGYTAFFTNGRNGSTGPSFSPNNTETQTARRRPDYSSPFSAEGANSSTGASSFHTKNELSTIGPARPALSRLSGGNGDSIAGSSHNIAGSSHIIAGSSRVITELPTVPAAARPAYTALFRGHGGNGNTITDSSITQTESRMAHTSPQVPSVNSVHFRSDLETRSTIASSSRANTESWTAHPDRSGRPDYTGLLCAGRNRNHSTPSTLQDGSSAQILSQPTGGRAVSTLVYSGNDWNSTSMTRADGNSPKALIHQGASNATAAAESIRLPNERDTSALVRTEENSLLVPISYLGDPSLHENLSAPIPPDQSTSLWIRGMAPSVVFSDILALIRNTGKVYSIFVNPPSSGHAGSAAKICFFTRAAAEKFFNDTRGGFLIKGHRAVVLWNRILLPEHNTNKWKKACRVVIVQGPRDLVNLRRIYEILDQNIRKYDLERATEKAHEFRHGHAEVELHFGSFRAQGESAWIVLKRNWQAKGVRVLYGTDPCE